MTDRRFRSIERLARPRAEYRAPRVIEFGCPPELDEATALSALREAGIIRDTLSAEVVGGRRLRLMVEWVGHDPTPEPLRPRRAPKSRPVYEHAVGPAMDMPRSGPDVAAADVPSAVGRALLSYQSKLSDD